MNSIQLLLVLTITSVAFGLQNEIERLSQVKTLAESAQSLAERYFAVCSVILHPYESYIPHDVFLLLRLLASTQHHTVFAANYSRFLDYRRLIDQTKCSRTMIVLYGDQERMQSPFVKLTLEIPMAGPFWLLILDDGTKIEEYLDAADLPFDLDLVVANYKDNDTVLLSEVYRVSRIDPYLPVRVQKYGQWTRENGLLSPPHISLYYGDRRNNLEGVTFHVATVASYPIVNLSPLPNGKTRTWGYFPMVWRELEERLNFSTKYFSPPDQATGTLRNGTWSGVMGMVLRGEAQLGLAAMSISAQRSLYVDFLRPLITTRNNLFFKRPGIEIRWDSIFRPFETGIWIMILVWVLLGAIFLRNLVRFGIIYRLEKHNPDDFNLLNSFFCVLRAFSQQGSPLLPSAMPGRILVLTSYLVSVVVLTAYSGALISFIAVKIPRIPFGSLIQLAEQRGYRVSVVKDTVAFMYFANATDPVLTRIYNMMTEDLPITNAEAIDRVCQDGKLVHFGPQAAMDMIVKERNLGGCDVMSMPHALDIVYMSVIIDKKNQYKDALNHHLDMMIYQGTLGRMRKQLWPNLGPLVPDSTVEVRAEQVVPIFLVLVAGLTVALIIFLVEKFKKKPPRKTSTISFASIGFKSYA